MALEHFSEKRFEKKYTPVQNLDSYETDEFEKNDSKALEIHALFQRYQTLLTKVRPYLKKRTVKTVVDGQEQVVAQKLTAAKMVETQESEWVKFIDLDKIRQEKANELAKAKDQGLGLDLAKEEIIKTIKAIVELRQQLYGDEENSIEISASVRDAYTYREKELSKARAKIKEMVRDLEKLEQSVDGTWGIINDPKIAQDSSVDYQVLHDKLKDYLQSDPEAFLADKYERILLMKEVFDKGGRIVETPYVLKIMASIKEKLSIGRPVFLHGELGSGKSELAKHLCKKELSGDFLLRWEHGDEEAGIKAHPKPLSPVMPVEADFISDDMDEIELEDAKASFAQAKKDYVIAKKVWRYEEKKWQRTRELAKEPYLISGHRGIEATQFLGGEKIERTKNLSPEEIVEKIQERSKVFRKKMEKQLTDQGEFEENRMLTIMPQYEEALKKFYDSPIEVVGYLGMFYKAMKEGKPIIIDELNAIPHHVLIMLNDLLTRKPGDLIKPMVEGVDEFTVKKGFYIIATGNWDPQQERYFEREKIDPAFLSRFAVQKYDYLPNLVKDELQDSEKLTLETEHQLRQSNELFQMLMVRLLDKNGSMMIREGDEKKVFNLAMVAKIVQNAFSGFKIEKKFYPDSVKFNDATPKDVVKDNVLSLRHLIPIVEQWKKDGFRRPLDYYIFTYFVENSKERPEELSYLYFLLQVVGNFFPTKTTNDEAEAKRAAEAGVAPLPTTQINWPEAGGPVEKVLEFDATGIKHEIDRETNKRASNSMMTKGLGEFKTYSSVEVVEMLFGRVPERKKIKKKNTLLPSSDEGESSDIIPDAEMTLEETMEFQRYKERRAQVIEKLKFFTAEVEDQPQAVIDSLNNIIQNNETRGSESAQSENVDPVSPEPEKNDDQELIQPQQPKVRRGFLGRIFRDKTEKKKM